MQLIQVEAQAACVAGECSTTEAWADHKFGKEQDLAQAWQLPKFNRSTSKVAFWWQFETAAEHNHWTPHERTTYLITALDEPTAHILHSVFTVAKYKEVTAALEICYGGYCLAEAFHAQLRRMT
jgi:hypothetical protein